MTYTQPHSFHIPVMGLAYTIDSPIKVARFGISSVISIVEDKLIEMMRKYYYPSTHLEYKPIPTSETDYRAKRITDYLNLVNQIVQDQMVILKQAAFEKGSEIVKYFEMLPEDNKLKKLYLQLSHTSDENERNKIESLLRSNIVAGSIDVNVMTKTDRENHDKDGQVIEDGSDAVSALRGYLNSNLSNSSIVFSAGMNPRLYNYLERCNHFDPDENGNFTKKVIIKVSDYRSALIQGKYLAKKGIWVSEFRIESGLNCGGHAFATDGFLLGPIMEEFKNKKQELIEAIFSIYNEALNRKGNSIFKYPPPLQFSVQGGIGTSEENIFLQQAYDVQSTGWGTPFLLVPEATTVDEQTLSLLMKAKSEDVVLSHNSPLGVRFHYLKGTSSHKEKLARILSGKPGSPCTEKHLAFNTEFTKESICTASHKYQKLKLEQIRTLDLPEPEYAKQVAQVLDKECLCIGLSNPAAAKYKIPFVKNLPSVTICPGPNIAYFSKEVSLQTMTDHIYGRTNIMTDSNRPHMFIGELILYIKYLREQLEEACEMENWAKRKKHFTSFLSNLCNGITYYKNIPERLLKNCKDFNLSLFNAEVELETLRVSYSLMY